MKPLRTARTAVVASLLVLGSSASRMVAAQSEPPVDAQPPVGSDDTDPSALTEFRSALDPYGTWVDDSTYGTVWIPNESEVGPDFEPYVTGGSWVSENGGNVWRSDYPWGDVVFHHGRWVSVPSRGWGWIPGRMYADAWVDWRQDEDYVGWAPTPPAWVWMGGVAVTLGFVPSLPFVYCPRQELFYPPVARHVLVGPRAAEIHVHSQPYGVPRHAYGPNDARPYAQPAPAPRPFVAPRPSIVAPVAPPRIVAPPAPPIRGPALRAPVQPAAPVMRHR